MIKQTRSLSIAAVTAALLTLAACGTQPNQPVYQGGATSGGYPVNTGGNAANAQYGVVQSIDLVQQENRSGIGAGAIVGAVVGGVVGNQVGKGDGKTAATVLGAAGGAYAGNEIQKRNQQSQGQDLRRINVRLYDGSIVSVTQDATVDIRVGDRVLLRNGTASRY